MTQISRDQARQLAQLSGLALSDDELDNLKEDIARILEYITQLGELDTSNVEPTYQVTGLENIWRDDAVIDDHVTREQLLALSPDSLDHQIKVPKVL